MLRITDPFRDIQYSRIKGEKKDVYFKVEFDEGKFYKVDNGYVLMADVTKYAGVVRAFKPEEPVQPGICAIPIYNKDYEIREKGKDGQYVSNTYSPSIHEKNLCTHLDGTISEDSYYKGSIAFSVDDQLLNLPDEKIIDTVVSSCHLIDTDSSGKLPEYQANTSSYSSYKKNNGYSRLTPADKATWVKKELCQSVKEPGYNEEMSLADLTEQFVTENKKDETFLALYFDLIKAILA